MISVPRDGYVDIHAHFTTPITKDKSIQDWQGMLGRGIYLPEPFEWSVERTLAYMDSQVRRCSF